MVTVSKRKMQGIVDNMVVRSLQTQFPTRPTGNFPMQMSTHLVHQMGAMSLDGEQIDEAQSNLETVVQGMKERVNNSASPRNRDGRGRKRNRQDLEGPGGNTG